LRYHINLYVKLCIHAINVPAGKTLVKHFFSPSFLQSSLTTYRLHVIGIKVR